MYQLSIVDNLPFEVIGTLPEAWRSDVSAFVQKALTHKWGGDGLGRLVVSNDLIESLREWMSDSEWEQHKASYEAGRNTVTAGKSFMSKDQMPTAVVPLLSEKADFMHLFGHEYLEAALDTRHRKEHHVWTPQTHTGLAHIYWTEYVVERSRQEIAAEVGLTASAFETVDLLDQIDEFERALPEMLAWASENQQIPAQAYQLWAELTQIWSMALGRDNGGSLGARDELRSFTAHKLAQKTAIGWRELAVSLQDAFARHERPAANQDQAVRESWLKLFDQFESLFVV